jgi:hypothetical protein
VSGSACVVTVHGIGFQQPPEGGRPGYADALHAGLRRVLGDALGDDPERPGPVYVTSKLGDPAGGLARLRRPLAPPGKIAHVALVYSPSEPLDDRPGSVADALARAAVAHSHYIGAVGALRLVLDDAVAVLHEHAASASAGAARSTLTARTDIDLTHHHGLIGRLLHHGSGRAGPAPSASGAPSADAVDAPGLIGTLRALEDDVATYVARNDLRERVRGFVEDALYGVLGRDDVSTVVVNAHSQGTVLCWDVLCRLPLWEWTQAGDRRGRLLSAFVTAGSPIRKYVDMFAWGRELGDLSALTVGDRSGFEWHNFWDPYDPVADPLDPAPDWRPGEPVQTRAPGQFGLLVARDPAGAAHEVQVRDVCVDNIGNSSGGGLQAHDYWNNQVQFVTALAGMLAGSSGSRSKPPESPDQVSR